MGRATAALSRRCRTVGCAERRIAGDRRAKRFTARRPFGAIRDVPGNLAAIPARHAVAAGGRAVGATARAPICITPDILDDAGRFLGQKTAGANAPLFSFWLSKADNVAEILPGGQVRHTTTITDPASSLNGRSVSVSYTEGVPDFSQLGVARVDIPNPIGRRVGIDTKADMRAASRVCAAQCRGVRDDQAPRWSAPGFRQHFRSMR
jgi:hypothetical protein